MTDYGDTIRSTTATMDDIADLIKVGSVIWLGTTGGSANAQTATVTPTFSTYRTGDSFRFTAGFTNTASAPTLNVNGAGAKTLKMNFGFNSCFVGDIVAGFTYDAVYNGTDLLVTNVTRLQNTDGSVRIDESWTYASATTITIPTGGASRFAVGDKLYFVNTTGKFFYIVGVADTLLTITGGSDYTFVNAAITSIYLWRTPSAPSFPQWFNWSPTLTGFSANPTNSVYRFNVIGRMCTVSVYQVTAGTSNATTFLISAPITAATISNMYWMNCWANATDNGAALTTSGQVYIASGASTITLDKTIAGGSWTAANGKRAGFQLSYEIA